MEAGTVLITGDSMLIGIDEERLQTRNDAKLRPFSGASTEDIASYLKSLMNKEPSVVIFHVGINDTTEHGIDLDAIVSRILNFKTEIEKALSDVEPYCLHPFVERKTAQQIRSWQRYARRWLY